MLTHEGKRTEKRSLHLEETGKKLFASCVVLILSFSQLCCLSALRSADIIHSDSSSKKQSAAAAAAVIHVCTLFVRY